jgi:hypothetical protein
MTTTEKEALKDLNSQICTTREQSEHLLALGLKKETADMCYRYVNTVKGEKKYELIVEAAWSQEVIDEYVRFGTKIGLFDNLVHPCGKPVTPLEARADVTKNDIPAWSLGRLFALVNGVDWRAEIAVKDERYGIHYGYETRWYDDIFEAAIAWIEDDIKEGYFNKEYLA